MTDTTRPGASEPATGSGRISLRTLVPIRWVAIAGQALALLTVHYGIGFHLPLVPALAVVAGSALLNVILIVHRQVARQLGERYAALCLGYDILQLAILLY
ncbi:MAG: sensor histidine kinase, partial [Stellaceae bacterium]